MTIGSIGGRQTHNSVNLHDPLWNTKPGTYGFHVGGIVLDGTNGVDGVNSPTYDIRPGWLLGRITATGLYVPLKRTRVNGTTGQQTQVVLDNSYAFRVGDVISIGSDTNITIADIDYATHTITIAATTVADNEEVVAQDGSATFAGILADFRRLRNLDNDAPENKSANMYNFGQIDTSKLYGDWAALLASIQSDIDNHPAARHFQFYTNGVLVA